MTSARPDDASNPDEPGSAGGDAAAPGSGTSRSMSVGELRDIYADQADWVDRMAPIDRLLFGRTRRRLFGQASGRVLDVACGTGVNVPALPDAVEYVGIDVSPDMLAKAADRYDHLELGEDLLEMDAQALALPDDSFDTVISSLSTCTFPDPGAALAEMARVATPDGRVLLLEHGRSSVGPIARFQDWRADAHFRKHGCRWNQEPLDVVADAPLRVEDSRRGWLGVVTAIEARPA